ncbi:MAG: hypothetical protein HY902_12910 [Deltaproteobacteria bacterium]|nr:hypothetical protein [Deltaproteobacteria bacterium]
MSVRQLAATATTTAQARCPAAWNSATTPTTTACNPKTGCAAAFATGSSCLGTDNKVHMCDLTTFKTVCVGCAKVP